MTLDDFAIDTIFAPGPAQKQASWIYDNWMPVGRSMGDRGVALMCINYDRETTRCLAYESRPPVCSQFPFYGDAEPDLSTPLGNVCGYQAELGRTILPLVSIT